jgi:hypothetical protein
LTTQNEAQAPNRFKVECSGVTIDCVGVGALEEATRVISGPSNQRFSSELEKWEQQMQEELKQNPKPKVAFGADSVMATRTVKEHVRAVPTGRTSSETPNEANTGKTREVEQSSADGGKQRIPVQRRIRLTTEETGLYDLVMECVGQGTKLRAAIEAFNSRWNLTMTKKEMMEEGLAKNPRSATGIIAQIRNKCANAAEINPDKIIFKDVATGDWCLNIRFSEYLNRRDN